MIHYTCFIDVIMKSSHLCPLCRADTGQYFACCGTALARYEQHFDSKILEIISLILLSIMRIENISQSVTLHHKVLQKYKEINYVAVIKIAKKVHKYLKVDVREYLITAMKKKDILVPPEPKKNNKIVIWLKKQIEKLTIDLKLN